MRKNKLDKSRWLCIEAEFLKRAGAMTGTYAVAYISDKQLEELFMLLDKTAQEFIKQHHTGEIIMT